MRLLSQQKKKSALDGEYSAGKHKAMTILNTPWESSGVGRLGNYQWQRGSYSIGTGG